MGIVVSTGKHEQMVAEKTNFLNEQKAEAERMRAELEAYKAQTAEEESALEQQLQDLETQKAKLVEQQKTLQGDYSEMESLRQEREAQVVQRCVMRITQRAIGVCFSEWKEFATDMVRERDRQKYSSKVEELATKNKHLKASVEERLKELAALEEQAQKEKATQLIMRLKYKEVSLCLHQWKAYVRANVEDRHARNVEALQQKILEMEVDRDRLREQLNDAEREGLKLAMAKFELEEKDLKKQSHISELADALTQARDTIERQVQQWPSSSKSMRRELVALNSAYEEVARASSGLQSPQPSRSVAAPEQPQPQPQPQLVAQPAESAKEALETAATPSTAESPTADAPSETEPAADSTGAEGAPAESAAMAVKPTAAEGATTKSDQGEDAVRPAEEAEQPAQ